MGAWKLVICFGAVVLAGCSPKGYYTEWGNNIVDIQAPSDIEVRAKYSIDPNWDCSNHGFVTVTPIEGPKHGSLRMTHEVVYPRFVANLTMSKCNEIGTPGVQVYYKSNTGYRGPDRVVFAERRVNGVVTKSILNIQVE